MFTNVSISHFSTGRLLSMDADTNGSAEVSDGSGPDRRRRVHGMLKLYYGLNEEGNPDEQPMSLDPCDINGPHFDPEHFLNKVGDRCCHLSVTSHLTNTFSLIVLTALNYYIFVPGCWCS